MAFFLKYLYAREMNLTVMSSSRKMAQEEQQEDSRQTDHWLEPINVDIDRHTENKNYYHL